MVYILLADGFEETESVVPCDLLRRAEVETKLVGVSGKRIVSSHGIAVEADMLLDEAAAQLPEMVVLPGGRRGVENLLASEQTLALVRQTWEAGNTWPRSAPLRPCSQRSGSRPADARPAIPAWKTGWRTRR